MTGLDDSMLRGYTKCGCCKGISAQTPVKIYNRPGLGSIAYRVGDHSQFYRTMLSRLQTRQELQALSTREEGDFSIALLDAWAVIADVLTFYQERIANESYLHTAKERRSVLELARTLGYELAPGVAASVYLAFDLEDAPGSPGEAVIEVGTKVQSTPGQDEKPQTFESVERLEARAEWNAIRPKLTEKRSPQRDDDRLYFKGIATNLKKGDGLLIVGKKLTSGQISGGWDFRKVSSVVADPSSDRTMVLLDSKLEKIDPSEGDSSVCALRLKASIFGYNALKLTDSGVSPILSENSTTKFDENTKIIYLDAVYSQIVRGSWIVLTRSGYCDASVNTINAYQDMVVKTELYSVENVGESTEVGSGIAAKTSMLKLSGENNASEFSPCSATVYAQSEELELAETPITGSLFGDQIITNKLAKLPESGRKLAISGKRSRVRVDEESIKLISVNDPNNKKEFKLGDELILVEPPIFTSEPYYSGNEIEFVGSFKTTWHLIDESGFEGKISDFAALSFIPAAKDDDIVSELADLKDVKIGKDYCTILTLVGSLKNAYDISTVTISANAVLATHGETTTEALGSGDATIPYQSFSLKQLPLTYTSESTSTGVKSTLNVSVNDMLWHEVPYLFGHGQRERVYIVRNGDDGKTTVQFGARLPTGRENIRANYRRGLGEVGNIKASQLNILMSRTTGVRGAKNPLPAIGGQDPQNLEDARKGAPLAILTLDRIVSLQDYEDFAGNYGGIAKAMATWIWNGERQGVLVTVAGPGGAEVKLGDPVHDNLLISMRRYGDPRVPLSLKSYAIATFKLKGWIKVETDVLGDKVKSEVEDALREHFSFDARDFGQAVTLGEVMSVIQNVRGVMASNVEALYRSDAMPDPKPNPILIARAPISGSDDTSSAEILTLDPGPIDLEVMP
ncbi:MAG: putative baseplate assembly protein [Methanotrichaceae archaeon]